MLRAADDTRLRLLLLLHKAELTVSELMDCRSVPAPSPAI
jgi:hypothetical protein